MSYEGFSQFLCKEGHYWSEDCYDADVRTTKCQFGHKAIWENMVDITNGSYETNPETGKEERIDGYVELEPKLTNKCDKCKSVLEQTFKIPRKGRYKRK